MAFVARGSRANYCRRTTGRSRSPVRPRPSAPLARWSGRSNLLAAVLSCTTAARLVAAPMPSQLCTSTTFPCWSADRDSETTNAAPGPRRGWLGAHRHRGGPHSGVLVAPGADDQISPGRAGSAAFTATTRPWPPTPCCDGSRRFVAASER